MRTLKFLLRKEFKQIFRSKALLRMMFMVPVVQLILLPFAANFEIRNINLSVVDHDHSSASLKFIDKILSSGYFKLSVEKPSYKEAFTLIEKDKADIVLEIPVGFERDLIRENKQKLFLAVNAINGTKAIIGSNYLNGIIRDYNMEFIATMTKPERYNPIPVIEVASSNWFNQHLTYYLFMVPGIMAMLLTIVAGNMTSLNIVKEKEIGTIEQINVTPIKKHIFILGKLIPFWTLGIMIFTLGLTIARLVYGIVPAGSFFLLYGFAAVYLFCMLGFGLLISTFSETQQQAQSLTFFFVMIFNMMSGLFTPIDSMPEWAKIVTQFIPLRYFIEIMRMIVLKGSGFWDTYYQMGALFLMGLVLNGWAVFNYRKTT